MAVAANQLIARRGGDTGIQGYAVVASKILYEGTMAFVTAGGYLTDVAAVAFAGIVREQVDNSAGADGAKNVDCWIEGVFRLKGSGFTIANIGDPITASDNYTIGTAAGVRIGTCVGFVSTTELEVKIQVGLAAVP